MQFSHRILIGSLNPRAVQVRFCDCSVTALIISDEYEVGFFNCITGLSFHNAELLLWRHRWLGGSHWHLGDIQTSLAGGASAEEMSTPRLHQHHRPLSRHPQLLSQQQGRMVPAPPTRFPRLQRPAAVEGAQAPAILRPARALQRAFLKPPAVVQRR